jgi:hypothetical protein
MYTIPDNPDIKKQTGVPFGLVLCPMAEVLPGEYPPPIVNLGEMGKDRWMDHVLSFWPLGSVSIRIFRWPVAVLYYKVPYLLFRCAGTGTCTGAGTGTAPRILGGINW